MTTMTIRTRILALCGGLLAVTWARVVRRRWAGYDEPAGL